MAGSSLLALIDDIASILDDVAVLTKVAAKKTSGVLGDDLALNAQQVSGVHAERELPVVWAVAKGSAVNKLILVPAALALSALAPWLVTPLLMVGGGYLCLEGFEKVARPFLPHRQAEAAPAPADPAEAERQKIRGAIRTDFVLSAEIVAITLGTVAQAGFATRAAALAVVAALMTVGVYGFVACVVKLDDLGLVLAARRSRLARSAGALLLAAAPRLLKGLAVAGTVAMFLVGGGIVRHGAHLLEPLAARMGSAAMVLDALVGLAAGALLFGALHLVQRLRRGGNQH